MATAPTVTPPVPTEANGGVANHNSTRFARETSHGRKGLRSYTMVTPIKGEGPLSEDDTRSDASFPLQMTPI